MCVHVAVMYAMPAAAGGQMRFLGACRPAIRYGWGSGRERPQAKDETEDHAHRESQCQLQGQPMGLAMRPGLAVFGSMGGQLLHSPLSYTSVRLNQDSPPGFATGNRRQESPPVSGIIGESLRQRTRP